MTWKFQLQEESHIAVSEVDPFGELESSDWLTAADLATPGCHHFREESHIGKKVLFLDAGSWAEARVIAYAPPRVRVDSSGKHMYESAEETLWRVEYEAAPGKIEDLHYHELRAALFAHTLKDHLTSSSTVSNALKAAVSRGIATEGRGGLQLKQHQLTGLTQMAEAIASHGAFGLFDEMGLGKTAMTVGLLKAVYNSHPIGIDNRIAQVTKAAKYLRLLPNRQSVCWPFSATCLT